MSANQQQKDALIFSLKIRLPTNKQKDSLDLSHKFAHTNEQQIDALIYIANCEIEKVGPI